MQKILIPFILILLTATASRAQTGWVTHKGDNRISIKFPSEPKEVIEGTFAAAQDSTISYVFTIIDFTKFGIDSVALAPMKATPDFATQLKTGIQTSLPDVNLQDLKIGNWKGFTSYTTTGTDAKKKQYDMLMFIIGNKMYSASTIRANGIGVKPRDDFFGSIELTH